jgi:hypothetical protein
MIVLLTNSQSYSNNRLDVDIFINLYALTCVQLPMNSSQLQKTFPLVLASLYKFGLVVRAKCLD